MSAITTNPWPKFTSPVIITMAALYWIRFLYFWQREVSFKRREQRRKEHSAEDLEIPSEVKKAEQYPGGQILDEAQWTYIPRAVEAQGNYFANTILSAILPALALFLLSFQLLAVQSGEWAIGMILSEISCLMILVYLALSNPEPTADWIENRIKAELFRREQYLLVAGVGPYLSEEPGAVEETLRRRGHIESADAHTMLDLVRMREQSGVTWLENLYRNAGKLPVRSDFVERMESYLYHRIGRQLVWFANELRDIKENERLWSRLLTGALLAAIGAAAIHVFRLYDAPGEARDEFSKAIGTLAIVLPPLGTACIGIRAMYNFRGRSRIYEHEKAQLYEEKGMLEALVQKAKNITGRTGDPQPGDMELCFRAIALRTEQSLSFELEQWVVLMERREHEVSP